MDDQYVDPTGLAAWIGERLPDLDPDTIAAVLRIEHEYMVATGITAPEGWDDFDPRVDYEYRHYQAGELDGAPDVVDTLRLAKDAERLAGVREADAHRVFEAELAFMEMRGLVGTGIDTEEDS